MLHTVLQPIQDSFIFYIFSTLSATEDKVFTYILCKAGHIWDLVTSKHVICDTLQCYLDAFQGLRALPCRVANKMPEYQGTFLP